MSKPSHKGLIPRELKSAILFGLLGVLATLLVGVGEFLVHYSASGYNGADDFSALVEKHFRSLHKVTDYADLMSKSPKTLSNAFKALDEKAPLQIIHERLILEAKKLLLYTDKSVKEISFEHNFSILCSLADCSKM